ncbi:hypothetical protein [Ignatzschineria cameli]|uniref:hypothetical protein n=1 Tax=Ignatzschineria cameli TaxID=2182793 RepID=UPI001057CB8A|nr:hypothetical protein [Ignatzschineria cameli]
MAITFPASKMPTGGHAPVKKTKWSIPAAPLPFLLKIIQTEAERCRSLLSRSSKDYAPADGNS